MKTKAKKMADILKLLANENRLLIFCALRDKSMTVSEISAEIPHITQSALSQHLRILKDNKILDCSKSGQNVTYFIYDNNISEIIDVLKKHYCDTID